MKMNFHENLTVNEVFAEGLECPVCFSVDKFYVSILEIGIYEKDGEDCDQVEFSGGEGLVGLTCAKCDFELINRTIREAIYIEENSSRNRQPG